MKAFILVLISLTANLVKSETFQKETEHLKFLDHTKTILDEEIYNLSNQNIEFGTEENDVITYNPFETQETDPTQGWNQIPFTYHIQKPWNVQEKDRYSFANNIHHMWILKDDLPHTKTSNTHPRTELGFIEHWNSGSRQFEGKFFIPAGSNGFSLFQIFGGGPNAMTAIMLHIHNGKIMYYVDPRKTIISEGVYNQWWTLNVIHHWNTREILVYINGVLKLTAKDNGPEPKYFKCGAYTTDDAVKRNDIMWTDIKYFEQ